MYNAHKITDKVAAGKLAIGSHVGFDSPFVTEMIAGCGFDFIWIDGEHSAIDRKDIQNHLMACRAGRRRRHRPGALERSRHHQGHPGHGGGRHRGTHGLFAGRGQAGRRRHPLPP